MIYLQFSTSYIMWVKEDVVIGDTAESNTPISV
jgi:hypothetical protein